jgi:hypothetical protein
MDRKRRPAISGEETINDSFDAALRNLAPDAYESIVTMGWVISRELQNQ